MKRFSRVKGLFGAKDKDKSLTEEVFWRWFQANESKLFTFDKNQEVVFKELTQEIQKVHEALTFQFSPVRENGKREFVISADGIKEAFPSVESLCAKAPAIDRWIWIKYRPRLNNLLDIKYDGVLVHPDNVHYLMAKDESKIGLVLFFDGLNEQTHKTFATIGFLFLDQVLGEYAVEMQVGFIEFHSRESEYFQQARPLAELQEHFDAYWTSLAN